MNNNLTSYKQPSFAKGHRLSSAERPTEGKQSTNYKKEGYTLIEVLVAVGIFSIATAIATSFFISSLGSQNRALSMRETIDNASHVMEYIARALRMTRKDKDGSCITAGTNYEITRGGRGIKFENYEEPPICQELYWEINDDRIYESKDGAAGLPLTSSDLEVTLFQFQLSGEPQSDDKQPRVTVLLNIARKSPSGPSFSQIRTQTTISQRNLDIMR